MITEGECQKFYVPTARTTGLSAIYLTQYSTPKTVSTAVILQYQVPMYPPYHTGLHTDQNSRPDDAYDRNLAHQTHD